MPVGGSGLTTNTLQTTTMTTFAVPTKNGTNGITFGANTNAAAGVKCDNTNCTLKVSGMAASDQYYMRARTIYKGAPLEITGQTSGGQEVQFTNSQVVIDATGKAQDVLRRLQVRVPVGEVGSQNQLPDNALQSNDSVCKRFSVMDNYYVSAVPGTISGSNVLCQP